MSLCHTYVNFNLSFADDRKLGLVDTSESCAAIQRDLNGWEKWEERRLVKLNQGKCRALQLRRNSSTHQYMPGADWLETSFEGKDLQVIVNSKSHLSL